MNQAVDLPQAVKVRKAAVDDNSNVLTDIYQEEVNLAVWQRELSPSVQLAAAEVLLSKPKLQLAMTLAEQEAVGVVHQALGSTEAALVVAHDMAELIGMFCCLFELERVALRVTALQKAMCPKFHVDRVPCRLVSTYQGIATEWLPHAAVDRSKLGAGAMGLPDDVSGLYERPEDIQQVSTGDVALLKGENWWGNEQAGLVHRSPALALGKHRLLMTLDFSA